MLLGGRSFGLGKPKTVLTILLCFWVLLPSRAEENALRNPLAVQAVYLYHFMNFISWPNEASWPEQKPFVICTDTTGNTHLDALTQKRIGIRPIISQFISTSLEHTAKLDACQILLLNSSSHKAQAALLQAIRHKPILTVGTAEGFLQLNGMIQFSVKHGQVTFSVNLKSTSLAGLKISANMLDVAQEVIQ